MREVWVLMLSLCAPFTVQSATHLPFLWPGEHLVTWGREPQCSKEQPNPYFPSSKQNERKKSFFLSLIFSSKPQFIQY